MSFASSSFVALNACLQDSLYSNFSFFRQLILLGGQLNGYTNAKYHDNIVPYLGRYILLLPLIVL